MLEAVLIRPDGTHAATTTGTASAICDYFDSIDWAAIAADTPDPNGTMPTLEVRRPANGDLLAIDFDGSKNLFQCYTVILVPKKIFGISTYLRNESWESPTVWLARPTVRAALKAFAAQDLEGLRHHWQQVA